MTAARSCAGDTVAFRGVVKIFYGPTRRPAQLNTNEIKIDYAGCAGNGSAARTDTDLGDFNGILVRAGVGEISFSSVTDGTSNTLMLGEKQLKLDRLGTAFDDNESAHTAGWDTEIFRKVSAVNGARPRMSGPAPTTTRPTASARRTPAGCSGRWPTARSAPSATRTTP